MTGNNRDLRDNPLLAIALVILGVVLIVSAIALATAPGTDKNQVEETIETAEDMSSGDPLEGIDLPKMPSVWFISDMHARGVPFEDVETAQLLVAVTCILMEDHTAHGTVQALINEFGWTWEHATAWTIATMGEYDCRPAPTNPPGFQITDRPGVR